MRRAHRVDANQPEIVRALRRIGATVVDLSAVGNDVPDLLVGYRGRWQLMEIKVEGGKLSKGQEKFYMSSQGPIFIVTSIDEALEFAGATKGKRK